MNGVNNGPTGSAARKTAGTAPYYKELEIPYARLHVQEEATETVEAN